MVRNFEFSRLTGGGLALMFILVKIRKRGLRGTTRHPRKCHPLEGAMSVTSRLGIGKSANAMHNAMHCAGAVAAACVMTAAAIPAYAGTGLVPVKAISLPVPLASWDISFVDPASHTYVLGDRSNNGVDVIDTRTNTLTMIAGRGLFRGVVSVCKVANSCSGPNGALIVN